ncbi:MAG: LLM class F420-dependent oxidoreductase [Actinomycetota bacterium]
MRFGVTSFLTDRSIPPAELSRELEVRGFDSCFVPEHTHIPTGRRTPAPMGEPLPEYYRQLLDPFVALTVVAMTSTTLRVGTGICLVAQRDPFVLAKEVATLDLVSGGRFVFGIGFGWNEDELSHHGVTYKERREVVREKVLAMRALWTKDEASFDGAYVRFDSSWSWPKPVQRPGPPVLLGGTGGPMLFRAIAEYGDGWIPIGGRGVGRQLPDLQHAYEDAGRDPSTIRIVPMGTIPDPGKLEHFGSLGIEEVVLGVESGTADQVLPTLDAFAKIVEPFRD